MAEESVEGKNLWLLKSEPSVFSFSDLEHKPGRQDNWDGVRNFQARNYLKAMKMNDLAFFYHSSCPVPGIVGVVKVIEENKPDLSFERKEKNPWVSVKVQAVGSLHPFLSLENLREIAKETFPLMQDWPLLRRGNRLSVIPVPYEIWSFIMRLCFIKGVEIKNC